MKKFPPLKALHPDHTLSAAKLAIFERMSSQTLEESLAPDREHCLKARPDGTMLDGHHRIYILRNRGEDVDKLPREILTSRSDEA